MAADHPVSRKVLIRISGILLLALLLVLVFARLSKPQMITFAECERRGGEAWLVDLYHPDICPDCGAFRSCLRTHAGDDQIFQICQAGAACVACLEENHPYPDRCPEGKQKIGEISDAAIWFQCCK